MDSSSSPRSDAKLFLPLCRRLTWRTFLSFSSETVRFLPLQQMTGSNGQEHCRDCAWLLKKPSRFLSLSMACSMCASAACVCVCSPNRQTSCANKNADCVCTDMWHTVRELPYKQCLVGSWNYFCSTWEDGNTVSQEPGQQQPFVLLADNTAALAIYWDEYDFYGYRHNMLMFAPNLHKLLHIVSHEFWLERGKSKNYTWEEPVW